MKLWLQRAPLIQITLIVVALGVLARVVRYALNFPLWGDEAFVAVNFIEFDYGRLFSPLIYGQIVPLGYSWATLTAAKLGGVNEYALRFVPLACGVATLFLYWRFLWPLMGPRATLLALGFLAGAFYPIRHGAEVKPYACDMLVALALLMLGWWVHQYQPTWNRGRRSANSSRDREHFKEIARRGTRLESEGQLQPLPYGRGSDQERRGSDRSGRGADRRTLDAATAWVVLTLAGAAAVWCSYPAIFVLGGIGLMLLWDCAARRRAGAWLGLLIYAAVVGGSFAAMAKLYAEPHAAAAAGIAETGMWAGSFPPLERWWRIPDWLLLTHAGNMVAYPNGGKNGASAATLILIVIGCVVLWRRNRPLLVLLLSPLLFNLAAAVLQKYPYGGTVRVMMYMAPAFCALAGLGLLRLLQIAGAALAVRRLRAAATPATSMPAAGSATPPVVHELSYARSSAGRQGKPFTGLFAADHAHLQAGVRIAALCLALFSVGSIAADLIQPYKKRANDLARETVRDVARAVQSGDRVIVYNAIEDVAHADYIAPLKGDGAQFIFYLKTLVPAPVAFAPRPEVVQAPDAGGETWLLVYHGANFPRTEERFEAYLKEMKSRLGEPQLDRRELQRKRDPRKNLDLLWQVIDVYRFPG